MARYNLDRSLRWKREAYYDGHPIWVREDFGGVIVAAVEGFRGGEVKTSGPNARYRAVQQITLRIDDMNNVE